MTSADAAEVDAIGLLCPLPILRCRQALARLPPGGTCVLWADDDAIRVDLPAFCEGQGHELVEIRPARHGASGRQALRSVVRKAS